MAYAIPGVTRFARSGAHRGEMATLERLESGLGPEFTIYHGVHWTRAKADRTAFGEIDFVVVNRDGRIVVIEQKNGPLMETADGLKKNYPDKVKSVSTQIHRNLDSIRGKFRQNAAGRRGLSVDYLLYCPDYRVARLNAAGLDAERIVDAPRRHDLARIVADTWGPGTGADSDFAEAVHRFFRQTFEVVPDVHAYKDEQDRSFTRLSAELVDRIGDIEMSPLRLRVKGVAGCGKTGIATHYYTRAAESGKRPLMLCFNRSLRENLNEKVSDDGLVQTWYGFCVRFLEDRGDTLDFNRVRDHLRNQDTFWSEVEDRVKERAIEDGVPESWRFDRLIIDEAQDFKPEWFEILDLFLKEEHDFLWLEDSDQNIRQTEPRDKAGVVGLRARRNYRSPEAIARFMETVLPSFDFECASPVAGFDVQVWPYDDPADQTKLAAARVTELRRLGFRPEDITLLTMRGVGRSAVGGSSRRLGGYALSQFQGYDRSGNQKMSDGQILFDSIHRFKGQQAPAVILCDVDPDPGRMEDWRRRLYCGMTRATVHLELLVARRANPLSEELLAAGR